MPSSAPRRGVLSRTAESVVDGAFGVFGVFVSAFVLELMGAPGTVPVAPGISGGMGTFGCFVLGETSWFGLGVGIPKLSYDLLGRSDAAADKQDRRRNC